MKWIIITISMILFLSSCNNAESIKADTNDRTELVPEPDKALREEYEKQQTFNDISLTINSFYKNYKGDFKTIDRNLISEDLAALIIKAIAREKREAIQIANSNEPTNKPLMIEGDIFTSLYEGAEHFEIDSIKTEGNKAIATVKFTNSTFKQNWVDEVLLIKQDRWLIDDVVFKSNKPELPTTKALLKHFIAQKNR